MDPANDCSGAYADGETHVGAYFLGAPMGTDETATVVLPPCRVLSADDINNRLQTLTNLVYLLRRRNIADETANEYLTAMQSELARLNLHLKAGLLVAIGRCTQEAEGSHRAAMQAHSGCR